MKRVLASRAWAAALVAGLASVAVPPVAAQGLQSGVITGLASGAITSAI